MTPEERRKAHLDLAVYDDQIEAEIFYNRLLAHLDVYEPAVADAIRYGLRKTNIIDGTFPATYAIDDPNAASRP